MKAYFCYLLILVIFLSTSLITSGVLINKYKERIDVLVIENRTVKKEVNILERQVNRLKRKNIDLKWWIGFYKKQSEIDDKIISIYEMLLDSCNKIGGYK